MSKVYNKIVQSNTEPSKNDIWLKDGQMKTFGKEGWKTVGGGVSEGNNESVGDKEIYVLDVTRTDYETLFNEVSEAWDSNKQIILNYLPEGNVPIFNILLTKSHKEEDAIAFGAGPVIIPNFYGTSCFMTPMLIIVIFKDNIEINNTSISEFTEESLGYIKYTLDDKICLSSHGDGTEFLSDDGTYKTIGSNLELFSFTDGEYITTDVYSRLLNKVGNQIPIASYINGNRLYSVGGYVDEGLVFVFVDYAKITKVYIYRDYRVSISTYDITSKINTLNNTITALEERIAALEGATA